MAKEEKVTLWSQVNELCRVTQVSPQEFDPKKHVHCAQEIIDGLDGKLKPSSSTQISYTDELGNEPSFDYGRDEKRLGQYVVTKYTLLGSSILKMEHFWDRDKKDLFEKGIFTNLAYGKGDKKLREIYLEVLEPHFFNLNLFGIQIGMQLGNVKRTDFYRK